MTRLPLLLALVACQDKTEPPSETGTETLFGDGDADADADGDTDADTDPTTTDPATTDPATLAWRAALGALAAMWVSGLLLRIVAGVINERLSADLVARDEAAAKATAAVSAVPVPARPTRPSPTRPVR